MAGLKRAASAALSYWYPTMVMCYWNLHRDAWSVKSRNEPVRHETYLILTDCQFVVWQGGRARVLREKKKNVHAFVKGDEAKTKSMKAVTAPLVQVSYNPYKSGTFYRKDTGVTVSSADRVVMLPDGSVWAENPR